MRILASHTDPVSGHTYAVIVNPIAGGLAGQPARRYRLIRSINPRWVEEANTLMSVSSTKGIRVYESFDCLDTWKDTPYFTKRRLALIHEARVLGQDPTVQRSTP